MRGGRAPQAHAPQPWFVASDLDGFFGLAIDNLIQFLLILGLCHAVVGLPITHVLHTVLPGAAVSILLGNILYARQAQQLSAQTGRRDVTALPYGINTVSLFAFVFLVMLPVKLAAERDGSTPEQAALTAWQVGLAACVLSGALELAGAFVAERVRTSTPRAALLSTLAGIAISFIAIDFAVRTFEMPLIALLPLGVILTTYFSRTSLPFGLPGGAWALALGTGAAWILVGFGASESPVKPEAVAVGWSNLGLHLPLPVLNDVAMGMSHPLTYRYLVPVMIPMGLFNVLGSLQNIESAEAAGDAYPTLPSLAINGAGSLLAAALGSCFPTTIYIGHPGWKGLGARSGYSVLNGLFFAVVALFGLTHLLSALIPIEAGMAIVLWIGIVITAQAFQATPRAHAPAVAFGLFPAIAGWGVLVLTQTLGAAAMARGDPALAEQVLAQPEAFAAVGMHLPGLFALSQGFMLTCLVWSAASACLIDRAFVKAAAWLLVGALAAFFGFTHAGQLSPAGGVYEIGFGTGLRWSIGYLLAATFFLAMQHWVRRHPEALRETAP